MSDQLRAIVEATLPERPGDDAFEPGPPQVRLMAVRAAVERLGWGHMHYVCEECGFGWDIWMTLGVEGPPYLREHGLYVASPFTLSRCPAWPLDPADGTAEESNYRTCDGLMAHDKRVGRDREFEPRLIPDDAPRFVLPRAVWRGGQGADLGIPDDALIAARRWHRERESGS